MHLNQLIDGLSLTPRHGDARTTLSGLTDDSRRVAPGSLFIARPAPAPGSVATAEALRFVPDAVVAGAIALLLPDIDDQAIAELALPESVAVVTAEPGVAVDQRLCGMLAERFFGGPSRQIKLIGVTGTNGKTTTVTITRHLLASAGHKCGLIGTVELDTGGPGGPRPAQLTTPGAIELSRLLAEMVANGCAYCVMEVSSHALHQGRADHLRFTAAAFTNLTQDHLDYHGTMEAYADAKAILFEGLDEDAVAVLNYDAHHGDRMSRNCCALTIWTAVARWGEGVSVAAPIKMSSGSSEAMFDGSWGKFKATLPMPGNHNLSNAIQAAELAHATAELDASQLQQGLETCRPVPGRLEPVGPAWPQPSTPNPQLPAALVDYAHTPDALENVGKALRDLTAGKLITVFGCGGDRDRAKRPLMAGAAQQHADVVVLTSDNPRTEDPQQILDDAAKGLTRDMTMPDPEAYIIMERAEAIRFAVQLASPGDTVLIAGKGHEDYQIIGTEKVHFDDREHAAAALRDKLINKL